MVLVEVVVQHGLTYLHSMRPAQARSFEQKRALLIQDGDEASGEDVRRRFLEVLMKLRKMFTCCSLCVKLRHHNSLGFFL